MLKYHDFNCTVNTGLPIDTSSVYREATSISTSNVGMIRTTCKRREIVRQVFGTRKIKYIIDWNLLTPQAYKQYVFVSRMFWNSQVNGQNL